MRFFIALTRLGIQRQIIYRAAMLAGLATNLFFSFLRAAVIVALYGERQQVAGIDIQSAVTYTGLTQGLIAFLSLFSWFEVIQSVNTGQVGAEMLKPTSYFTLWMGQDFGRSLVNLITRGLTLMLLYALAFDITIPRYPAQWLGLLVALLMAWLVSFAWRFLINLAAFWTPNAVGVARLAFGFSWLFSGFLMPLRFFPPWFSDLCHLTPFPHMVNTVVEVYLGLLSGTEMLQALLMQLAWALALIITGQLVLRAGLRKLVIQGG